MEIYLIRHTSVDVPKGTCYGFTDVPLQPSFESEASQTRKQLEGITFDRVFTSPLSRATKLAHFCGYPDAIPDDRLKEMNMGEWEMKKFDEINDPQLQKWYDHYIDTPTTGGESFRDLYHRVSHFLNELRTHDEIHRVAIFAHGGVLIWAQVFAGEIDIEKGMAHLTPYGGVIKINI